MVTIHFIHRITPKKHIRVFICVIQVTSVSHANSWFACFFLCQFVHACSIQLNIKSYVGSETTLHRPDDVVAKLCSVSMPHLMYLIMLLGLLYIGDLGHSSNTNSERRFCSSNMSDKLTVVLSCAMASNQNVNCDSRCVAYIYIYPCGPLNRWPPNYNLMQIMCVRMCACSVNILL